MDTVQDSESQQAENRPVDTSISQNEPMDTVEPIVNEIGNVTEQESPIVQNESISTGNSENVQRDSQVNSIVVVERDPAKRVPINSIQDPMKRDATIREYIRLGPFQPKLPCFPVDNTNRKFKLSWFALESCSKWLEYSPSTNKCYCLVCYLFSNSSNQSFVQEGFDSWKHMLEKGKGVNKHIGSLNSFHNNSLRSLESFVNQKQSITHHFQVQNETASEMNKKRLILSIEVAKHLTVQGLSFRGHDESSSSLNKGNFLELLEFKAKDTENEELLKNAPKNAKYTSSDVQKELCHCISTLVQEKIREEINNECFTIIADECRDVSGSEWMVLVIRFIDSKGNICERVLDFEKVVDTTSDTLFDALTKMLNRHNLSIYLIRAQNFDGAANMKGRLNGLQAKVNEVNPLAFYFHCWAHKLNLVVVEVCQAIAPINSFFYVIQTIHNLIANSPKSRELLKSSHALQVASLFDEGLLQAGTGKNQVSSVGTLSSTRWSSHFNALKNIKILYPSIIHVLNEISTNSADSDRRARADMVLDNIKTMEFIFNLHLMIMILEAIHTLSNFLQNKSENLVNAIRLIRLTKSNLNNLLSSGFNEMLKDVIDFCTAHDVDVLPLDDIRVTRGRPRNSGRTTNQEYLKFQLYENALNLCLTEMERRFNENQCEILSLISTFDPKLGFESLSPESILKLTNIYHEDFKNAINFETEARDFVKFVKVPENGFLNSNSLQEFVNYFIAQQLHEIFPNIFRLLKLILLLPISTASAERSFSCLKIIKTRLRSTMGDQWLVDQLIPYINKDITKQITTEQIYKRYIDMAASHRRGL